MIHRVAISGYRSIRSLTVRLGTLSLVTGPNGSGKTNLYRALRLLSAAANGQLNRTLAMEGGFDSVLWAGPEKISKEMQDGIVPVQGTMRSKPVALKLGISAEPLSYCVDLGRPVPARSMFDGDPEVKRECIWAGPTMDARALCADRRGQSLRARSGKGKWQEVEIPLTRAASLLTEYADPFAAPEVILMRRQLQEWRFYDTFRCDAESPARQASAQTYTPIMSDDGADLAAAVQTILEIGDGEGLCAAIDAAFPGCSVEISKSDGGMQLAFQQPGMLRKLSAQELSDGTLRYLLLVAALHSPRPPEFLVLNEPEASLHPTLIPALASMILKASESSQIVVVSHNERLVNELEKDEICQTIRLQKTLGETLWEGASLLEKHGWKWPSR